MVKMLVILRVIKAMKISRSNKRNCINNKFRDKFKC